MLKRLVVAGVMLLAPVVAAAQGPTPYGAPISLEQARAIAVAAEAEAAKNQWAVVVAIVDTGGHLVLLHKLDNTQTGSIEVARKKAVTAALFRRPTKGFEDSVAGPGGARFLAVPDLLPIEGGLPLISGGRIIGAIGVSGVTSQQDGMVAAAGVAALK